MFVPGVFTSQPPAKPRLSTLLSPILPALLLFLLPVRSVVAAETALSGTPLNDGYHALYNLDFPSAHTHFQQWMTAHPEDCLGPASDAAAFIFTEFDRLGVLDIELFADDDRF